MWGNDCSVQERLSIGRGGRVRERERERERALQGIRAPDKVFEKRRKN